MKRLTAKGIKKYLIENYGECRHDEIKMFYVCKEVAENNRVKPLEVFHFMVEQEPISSLYTHSYGFNTSEGRAIREEFEDAYYRGEEY